MSCINCDCPDCSSILWMSSGVYTGREVDAVFDRDELVCRSLIPGDDVEYGSVVSLCWIPSVISCEIAVEL